MYRQGLADGTLQRALEAPYRAAPTPHQRGCFLPAAQAASQARQKTPWPDSHAKGMRTGSEPPLEAACGDEVADLAWGTAVAALACRRLPWLFERCMPAPLLPLMPSFSLGSWGSWGAERSRRRAVCRGDRGRGVLTIA